MRTLIKGTVSLALILMIFNHGFSQELPKAHKMENTSWHEVVMLDFKSGMESDAMNIINEHFKKAVESAGIDGPAKMLRMETGKWDLLLVWNMDSINDLSWEVSPENAKWIKALAEQEGGPQEAMDLLGKYESMIQASTSYLATSKDE